jgi:hypothetical protein
LTASSTASSTNFSTLQILAWPGAQCTVQPVGNTDPEQVLPVFADDLGVVQFGAMPAAPGDTVTALSLDCHDDAGRTHTYPIDLTAAKTFNALPSNAVAVDPRSIRPALTGDPMSYSQQDLLNRGYGLRPDPAACVSRINRGPHRLTRRYLMRPSPGRLCRGARWRISVGRRRS